MKKHLVSVIIPAHNRPDRLRRLLDYYSNTNIDVVVADSSKTIFPYTNDFPGITYWHFPQETFLKKIYEILDKIETPYVFFCADDDFIVPGAVDKIIQFLEENPDYSVAQGHYLTFEVHKKNIEFTPRYIRNFDHKITADTASLRLAQYNNCYASHLYGVIRTTVFKKMYQACINDGQPVFRNLYLAEWYFILFSLINGKYATIPCFYSAREHIYDSATVATVPISVVSTAAEYQQEFSAFLEILAAELAKQDKIPLEEAENRILQIIRKPKEKSSITLKRKLLLTFETVKSLRLFSGLLRARYKQKGLKATRGMQSYPCTFMTPAKQAIIDAINKYR